MFNFISIYCSKLSCLSCMIQDFLDYKEKRNLQLFGLSISTDYDS
jgi:hypothetical protein